MDANRALEPLLALYRDRPHPLEAHNRYQLLVMVLLSAQDSDQHINELAPGLFSTYPSLSRLAEATEGELLAVLHSVNKAREKVRYLVELAVLVGADESIPTDFDGLLRLPGIGRKSANLLLREWGLPAQGILVDRHVLRVAPRLGLAFGTEAGEIEDQLMKRVDRRHWGEVGMALSFLGRETCRPDLPRCGVCVMNSACVGRQQ